MKVKTSVTLPKELLLSVDAFIGKKHKRSAIIEQALRQYITTEKRKALNKRDMEIINANADALNKQAAETLEFQAEW